MDDPKPRRFPLGRIALTPGAREHLPPDVAASFIERHNTGDFGDLDEDDRRENEFSIPRELRILSRYTHEDRDYYVITEADRSVTTVLLCSEY